MKSIIVSLLALSACAVSPATLTLQQVQVSEQADSIEVRVVYIVDTTADIDSIIGVLQQPLPQVKTRGANRVSPRGFFTFKGKRPPDGLVVTGRVCIWTAPQHEVHCQPWTYLTHTEHVALGTFSSGFLLAS